MKKKNILFISLFVFIGNAGALEQRVSDLENKVNYLEAQLAPIVQKAAEDAKAERLQIIQKYDFENAIHQTNENCGGTGAHPKPCQHGYKCCVKSVGGAYMKDKFGRGFSNKTVICIPEAEKCVTKALK